MCEKTTYSTFSEAEKVVSHFKNLNVPNNIPRRFATKKPKRAYKCEICGLYHITSQKKKR